MSSRASQDELEQAFRFRLERGWLEPEGALRVFHGPAEARGALARYAIDRFGDYFWITEWEGPAGERDGALAEVGEFLEKKNARGAVFLPRPERGLAPEPSLLLGTAPEGPLVVREGRLRFGVRLLGVRHPGLFLDHRPLRGWIESNLRDRTVLNCFAYTGSLSVAAGMGGACHVTTLDLSKPSVQWAEENWRLNGLPGERARFIAGDVFERLPRFERRGERFDCVILDPPSFSRGNKGSFSTAKDLPKLHRFALGCVADGGVLITSINSANVTRAKFEAEVEHGARDARVKLELLAPIGLAEEFRGPRAGAGEDYLKGLIVRVRR